MYRWLLYVHIGSVLLFMLAHGVQVMVTWKKRWEADPTRNQALFDALPNVWPLRAAAASVVLSGFALVWAAGSWTQAWIWLSLALLVAIWLTMWRWGGGYYNLIQDAAERAIAAQATRDESAAMGAFQKARMSWQPMAMTVFGVAGVAVILWLMIFKPF